MVVDHMLFDLKKFIPETQEVKTKLADYDQLKAFHDTAVQQLDHKDFGGFKYRVWIDESGKIQYKQII